jgi:hypothetical protein
MYLAAKTTASAAETWAIVIVAVICLGFWLIMVVAIAPRPDARRRASRPALQVPLAGAMEMPHLAAPGTAETRDDMPPVPGPRPEAPAAREPAGTSPMDLGGRMPAQRESATDEAAPSRRRDR